MAEKNTHPQPGIEGQMLLPGHHDCLTWQLNVTVYPKQKAIRWVSIVRDPDARVEIQRHFREATDATPEAIEALQLEEAGVLLELRRLSGW
mgnify:CR=1 FL=1